MRRYPHVPSTEDALISRCQVLEGLLNRAAQADNLVAEFDSIRLLLETLPLATAEFSLAVNRLANARHYLESGEYGAARYELRLLRGGVAT